VSVEVVVEDVRKSYEGGRVRALDGLSLEVPAGGFVAVTGPSGCGKSTLLNLVGALDRPDAGEIRVGGRRLDELDDEDEYRAATVGFVFQFHDLVPVLSALENVQVPMLGRRPRRERERRAHELLDEVGLGRRAHARPPALSGGERQRVALARALANEPPLLLADEPTGSLDSRSAEGVLALLRAARDEHGATVLLVTNDEAAAAAADRVVPLRDGRVDATRAGAPRSA
jgi:putative ABC transport system ATP-binding protein